jgi:hypothetical protein
MRHHIAISLALCLSLPVCAACGSDAPPPGSDGDGGPKATGPLLPWRVGNHWTYRVSDDTGLSTKETTIESEETVGGTGPNAGETAYRVVTRKQDGADQTISWQIDVGDTVVRYREQAFSASTDELELEEHWSPSKLHIDGTEEHTRLGAEWLLTYSETKITPDGEEITDPDARDLWSVEAVGEEITVPAGTFHDCIVFRKVGGSSPKTYWYQRGIGKIKETGSQTEELVAFELVQ